MHRRRFIALLGGAIALPCVAAAQQKAIPVIGWLSSVAAGPLAHLVAAFRQGLSETGYVEGQNVAIEYRWADYHNDRLPAFATDLVERRVDVIVASGALVAVLAAKSATSTIPIVFPAVSDPVGAGLVASLGRPGGNVTGFSPFQWELMPKRLELLTDLVPYAMVIALLMRADEPRNADLIRDLQEAARAKGLQLHILKVSTEDEIDDAFTSIVQLHAGALLVAPDALFNTRREQLVALAARYSVPAIYEWREFAAIGGLISYGSSLSSSYRQAGAYVGRILKGEKPVDLAVQQPTRFELVVNLKTARELGLTIPPSILARADEVIE